MELANMMNGAAQATALTQPSQVAALQTSPRGVLRDSPSSTPHVGVVISLSAEATAILDGQDAESPSTDGPKDLNGNPLAGSALADQMGDSLRRIFGDAEEVGEDGVFNIYSNEASQASTDTDGASSESRPAEEQGALPGQLPPDQQAVVSELKARDAAVRAHELAHVGAAGGLAGSPVFSYQTGPDGRRYAVGGHVSIDTSGGSTHEETIAKAQRIRAAALAPADPSGADRAVAAGASQMETRARASLARQSAREAEEALESVSTATESAATAPSVDLPDLPEVDLEAGSAPPELTVKPSSKPIDVSKVPQVEAPSDLGSVSIGGGRALLATPTARVPHLSVFQGGSGAEAQLYSGSESQLVDAFVRSGANNGATQSAAMRLVAY